MTLLLKTDRSIEYVALTDIPSGIAMDFRQNKFFVNRMPATISSVLNVETAVKKGYLGYGGSYKEVDANTPKIGLNPINKKRGLHVEGKASLNILESVALSLPSKYTHQLAFGDTVVIAQKNAYTLSMQGHGSIDVYVPYINFRATLTQDNPVFITPDIAGTYPMTLTKTGDVSYISLVLNSGFNSIPLDRNYAGKAPVADVVKVAATHVPTNNFTVICEYSHAKEATSIRSNERNLGVFSIQGVDFELLIGSGTFKNSGLGIVTQGVAQTFLADKRPRTNRSIVAVTVQGSNLKYYKDGLYIGEIVLDAPAVTRNIFLSAQSKIAVSSPVNQLYHHQLYVSNTVIADAELLTITAI